MWDIITKIDGLVINKMNDLKKYVYSKKPKEKVKLTVQRLGVEYEVEVELGNKI